MSTKQLVSVRVDGELWKRVRMTALEIGETAAEFVEAAIVARLTVAEGIVADEAVPVAHAVRPDPTRAVLQATSAAVRVLSEPVCRRCGHREGAHSRGAQGACGQMGCSCARFRGADEA